MTSFHDDGIFCDYEQLAVETADSKEILGYRTLGFKIIICLLQLKSHSSPHLLKFSTTQLYDTY